MKKGELLRIETGLFTLVIVGPVPVADSFALRNVPASEEQSPQLSEVVHRVLRFEEASYSLVRVLCVGSHFHPDDVNVTIATDLPLFFEHIDYNVQLSSAPNYCFRLTHDAPEMTANLVLYDATRDNGVTHSGTFNFGANVGQTHFEIVEESGSGKAKKVLRIEASVFSSKIDYLRDRAAMLRDMSLVHHALIFRLLRPTSSEGSSASGKSLGIEWLSTFAQLAHEVVTTTDRIERQSHHRIVTRDEVTSTHKVRRPSRSLNRHIERTGLEEALSRRNVAVERRRVAVDTAENRYLKFLMRRLVTQGHHWLKIAADRFQNRVFVNAEDGKETTVQLRLKTISADLLTLERQLKRQFWVDVGAELPQLQNKTTFLFHPLFMRLEKLSKTINRAITLHRNGSQWISTLSMDQLYQNWTYLKIVEIADVLITGRNTAKDRIAQESVDAFEVIFNTGREKRVRLASGIFICAQRLFRSYSPSGQDAFFSPLVSQQPDLIFEIERDGVIHLLDAKYRIDVLLRREQRPIHLNSSGLIAEAIGNDVITMSPKDEDLNEIHRYRDAILRRSQSQDNNHTRAGRYGLILYPHRLANDEHQLIAHSQEYIALFEIGAIPLTPGAKDEEWVEAFMRKEWIPQSPGVEQVRVLAGILAEMLLPTERNQSSMSGQFSAV